MSLLAAIDEAAAKLTFHRATTYGNEQNSSLLKDSKVNATVARDLVSNASTQMANMTDFKDMNYHRAKKREKMDQSKDIVE